MDGILKKDNILKNTFFPILCRRVGSFVHTLRAFSLCEISRPSFSGDYIRFSTERHRVCHECERQTL